VSELTPELLLLDRRRTIFNFMEQLKEQINLTYAEHGVSLPERQFMDLGSNEAPVDCEQLVIYFQQMLNGPVGVPDQMPTPCYGPRSATFVVELHRCTPQMTQAVRGAPPQIPKVEALNASAEMLTTDAWMLMDAGLMAADDTLSGGIADVLTAPESGGFQAVVLNLVVGLQ
jgi:hypothetical protein